MYHRLLCLLFVISSSKTGVIAMILLQRNCPRLEDVVVAIKVHLQQHVPVQFLVRWQAMIMNLVSPTRPVQIDLQVVVTVVPRVMPASIWIRIRNRPMLVVVLPSLPLLWVNVVVGVVASILSLYIQIRMEKAISRTTAAAMMIITMVMVLLWLLRSMKMTMRMFLFHQLLNTILMR